MSGTDTEESVDNVDAVQEKIKQKREKVEKLKEAIEELKRLTEEESELQKEYEAITVSRKNVEVGKVYKKREGPGQRKNVSIIILYTILA